MTYWKHNNYIKQPKIKYDNACIINANTPPSQKSFSESNFM